MKNREFNAVLKKAFNVSANKEQLIKQLIAIAESFTLTEEQYNVLGTIEDAFANGVDAVSYKNYILEEEEN